MLSLVSVVGQLSLVVALSSRAASRYQYDQAGRPSLISRFDSNEHFDDYTNYMYMQDYESGRCGASKRYCRSLYYGLIPYNDNAVFVDTGFYDDYSPEDYEDDYASGRCHGTKHYCRRYFGLRAMSGRKLDSDYD